MNIVIFGPQGSGKGTQAELVAKRFNLFYFESGKFLRSIAKNDSAIDRLINKKGVLLPDGIVFSLMSKYLQDKVPDRSNLLFDGYPRSVKQYELLKNWLAEKGQKIDHALYLEVSEKESIKRLSARRIDRKTGKIYNLITNPPGPKVKKINLYQRPDDKPAAIEKRLRAYHESTEPLIEVFKKEKILVKLNGERPINDIFEEIVDRIK